MQNKVSEENQRIIKFEKIVNARELGGIKNSEGKHIRHKALIRSASIAGATDNDIHKLTDEYNLSAVIDLRTKIEREQKPDIRIENIQFFEIPVFEEAQIGITHEQETETRQKHSLLPIIQKVYSGMVTDEKCQKNFGRIIRTIMENDFSSKSILWHCTEGKDRCGIVTAIILMSLYVDRQTIIEDYLMTNIINMPKAEMIYQKAIESNMSEEKALQLKDFFMVKEEYIQSALDIIDEKYSNIDLYLEEALGIPKDIIYSFRENVLE